MHSKRSGIKRTALAVIIGALGGGLVVAFATRAIPHMISRMMAQMMGEMMACMGAEGLSPEER